MSRILIIDDDKALCRTLQIRLEESGHEVHSVHTATSGIEAYNSFLPEVVFLDLNLPDQYGLGTLKEFQKINLNLPVVIITGQQDMKATIEAMRLGAFDYLRKPFDMDEITLLMEKTKSRALQKTEKQRHIVIQDTYEYEHEIVGMDKKIINVVKQIGLLSRSKVNVLIEGESGTGKELVARALHESGTSSQPFIPINCSAVVPTLLESELFGHERGSFTGAVGRKMGKLEFAGEGTVFFDEVGDMPLDLQAKILRVIQEREFERVGGLDSIAFHARIISATNQNLMQLIRKGRFREDLYYRLAVSRILLPPLRERREDIPLLVNHLMGRIGRKIHRSVKAIEENVLKRLEMYEWPGNVRELENVLTRAIALSKGDILTSGDMEISFTPRREDAAGKPESFLLEDVEKSHIGKVLEYTGGNISRSARLLGISPTTLRKKIHDYNLKRPGRS